MEIMSENTYVYQSIIKTETYGSVKILQSFLTLFFKYSETLKVIAQVYENIHLVPIFSFKRLRITVASKFL